MLHFYNTFLNLFNILSLFSGEIIISSTGSCFSILSWLDVVTAPAILFPKISRALSNNCFLYFVVNDKNPYPLTYFLVLGSIEYHVNSIY